MWLITLDTRERKTDKSTMKRFLILLKSEFPSVSCLSLDDTAILARRNKSRNREEKMKKKIDIGKRSVLDKSKFILLLWLNMTYHQISNVSIRLSYKCVHQSIPSIYAASFRLLRIGMWTVVISYHVLPYCGRWELDNLCIEN